VFYLFLKLLRPHISEKLEIFGLGSDVSMEMTRNPASRRTSAIRRARGTLKRGPCEKPFRQSWADYKKEEKALEERRLARLCRGSVALKIDNR